MHAEGPEVTGEKWNVFLVAVSCKRFDVRYVFAFGLTHAGGSFLNLSSRFGDLRVGIQSEFYALFTLAVIGRHRNIRIESDISLEWKPYDIVEIQPQIRELKLRRQQLLIRLQ